ncbi:MAG: fumarylacetoacetate hydrolase family protein [Candidatus Thermoplasmatota archaeon]|nr:fumarylacetoacetate hydrolase family protein [Euryarchaeota archaeon]MBU4032376.1 fumarylacetoacetate hydrolase family protein [Candidatus Thermoplasmatota archaeon]MBU4070795.1 fumarylacetoacetate hydrolase family protein [Candidatus Thermoplasmatota archaeon]MBU4144801.1 fumarylacetoacetate hydrolase family protein [Candidatus Thermoplasmatota archaeon]MBU4591629.1 fumarylacetoacetate hydrolase family protein [Candidatus Thermoplasmatota archaeon]
MTFVKIDGKKIEAGKIICLLRSYRAHAEEMGSKVSEKPEFFLKPGTAIIHGGDEIIIPGESDDVHHEVELAVIIGKPGKNISVETAMEHVAGYAVMIDVTARDIQAVAKKAGKPWTVAKGFDTFAPISDGVSASRVPDPRNLEIWLKVNGQYRQRSCTGMMIYSIPEIISHISGIMTLEAGDIIATGTPEGVSRLVPGDAVTAGIGSVGEINVSVSKCPVKR